MVQYTLQDTLDITFNGFDIQLPEETIKLIQELSSQVGSPTYIKTPNFPKKTGENLSLNSSSSSLSSGSNSSFTNVSHKKGRSRNREMDMKRNRQLDINIKNSDWENLRTFQATKIEQKVGLDVEIDMIRYYLNIMSDKNYMEMRNNIIGILDKLIEDGITDENMNKISGIIFDIASTNRFFSKLYAELYSDLMIKYEIMQKIFENSFKNFMELFILVEHVDPEKDYDKFCIINKNNEMRKALSAFFVNLCNINVLSIDKIINLIQIMLGQVIVLMNQPDKKSELDEFTENIAILYNKTLVAEINKTNTLIDGITIKQTIEKLSKCKTKDYQSLSSKSIFKYMDLTERNC